MQLILSRSALLTAVSSAASPVGSKTTLPVLHHLRLVASSGRLEITGTNLDQFVHATVAANVVRPGEICLPAKPLHRILRSLQNEEIELELTKNSATFICGSSRYTLVGLPADEFPHCELSPASTPHDPLQRVSLPASETLAALKAALNYASDDASRHVLQGAALHFHAAGTMAVVATDGRQLFEHLVPIETGGLSFPEGRKTLVLIVPADGIRTLVAITPTPDPAAKIEIAFNHRQLSVNGELLGFGTRLTEGNFPNYLQVIPGVDGETTTVTCNLDDLDACLRRCALIDHEKVELLLEGDRIRTVSGRDGEEARDSISCSPAGKPLAVCFHPEYLRTALGVVAKRACATGIHFKSESSPVLVATEDGRTRIVIMPRSKV